MSNRKVNRRSFLELLKKKVDNLYKEEVKKFETAPNLDEDSIEEIGCLEFYISRVEEFYDFNFDNQLISSQCYNSACDYNFISLGLIAVHQGDIKTAKKYFAVVKTESNNPVCVDFAQAYFAHFNIQDFQQNTEYAIAEQLDKYEMYDEKSISLDYDDYYKLNKQKELLKGNFDMPKEYNKLFDLGDKIYFEGLENLKNVIDNELEKYNKKGNELVKLYIP